MDIARLRNFLKRHNRIALDTSVFIYELEANAKYTHLTHAIFAWLEQPKRSAVTSTITMTELLVRPYIDADMDRIARFYSLGLTYPNLAWVAADLAIANRAARIRAFRRLKTADALQAATAIHSGATGLITNDAAFERLDEFETLVLERSLPTH